MASASVLTVLMDSIESNMANPEVVNKYIVNEVRAGNLQSVADSDEWAHCSPINMIPKSHQPEKFRLKKSGPQDYLKGSKSRSSCSAAQCQCMFITTERWNITSETCIALSIFIILVMMADNQLALYIECPELHGTTDFYSAHVSLLVAHIISAHCCYSLKQLGNTSNQIYTIQKPSRHYHSVFATLRRYIATALLGFQILGCDV